jgi:hypothetical protein
LFDPADVALRRAIHRSIVTLEQAACPR